MEIEILKLHILNCIICGRDTLMAEVKIETGPGEPVCNPFMLFCSGCGNYLELPNTKEGPIEPEV